MSRQQPLTPELEAKAQELLTRLRPHTDEDLLALCRLLVSKQEDEIFGDTEFEVRALAHRLGPQAFETHLAEKKRLPRLGSRLPALPGKRQIPRVPRQSGPESVGAGAVPAGLLLLRPLWPGCVAVG
jgi:hypothetical protein